jgi:hypothetical protein
MPKKNLTARLTKASSKYQELLLKANADPRLKRRLYEEFAEVLGRYGVKLPEADEATLEQMFKATWAECPRSFLFVLINHSDSRMNLEAWGHLWPWAGYQERAQTADPGKTATLEIAIDAAPRLTFLVRDGENATIREDYCFPCRPFKCIYTVTGHDGLYKAALSFERID